MKCGWAAGLCGVFLWAAAASFAAGQSGLKSPAGPPAVDKAKLEQYIRFAEAYSPNVKITVDDPLPTPIRGYFRLPVHLSAGETKQDKTYYLSADGQHVLAGPVWDLGESPFVETAAQLPANGPSFGPPNARITLIVFSDFQCPYCREFAHTIREKLPQQYPKDVRVIFKDFPIASLHPWAEAAAEAGHCVGDGREDIFWAFHDWTFEHQGELNNTNLHDKILGFAREHGLDSAKVASCLDTHAPQAEVAASLKEGRRLDVQQTPTFFLNGRTISGAVSWSSLNTLIQMELNRPSFIPPSAAQAPPAGSQPSR